MTKCGIPWSDYSSATVERVVEFCFYMKLIHDLSEQI